LRQDHGRLIGSLEKAETLLRALPSRKNRLVSLVVLLAVPVFVLFVGLRVLNGRTATAQAQAQNQQLERQAEALEAQNEHYLAVLDNNDPDVFRDYVVRTARERLGLSLPGDRIFIDRSYKSGQ
jgi:cell division protein FtsB